MTEHESNQHDSSDSQTDGVEHQHDVDEVFEAPHKGRWKVTNRMVDVDTGELLYRLRDLDPDCNQSEILTESQIQRIYGDGKELRADGGEQVGQFEEGDRVRHYGEDIEGQVADTGYTAPKFKVEWDDGHETLESFHSVEKLDGGAESGEERLLDDGERSRSIARGEYADTELEAKIAGPDVTADEYYESLTVTKLAQDKGSLAGWTKLTIPADPDRVEELISVLEDAHEELLYLRQAQQRPQPGDRDE